MDKASRALAQGVPLGVPTSYRALADHSGAKEQQYLKDYEEAALVNFLLQLSDLGQPVRIKKRPTKPPGKNWSKDFRDRHPDVEARRVQALDWNRHEKHIYSKVVHCCSGREYL
ncbi:hypothetical protein DM02DRAFT_646717 [Periconia macrospinosa]|uniref:HTH CENPB-type domain-containing protein n=1 Tax=Periconia macrospinosa TaxID=97972 RepID=A0A2V1D4C2_9PLEO|nr:hypothetical protein DM02DRAFT_646717 [Periconia macrospinosa]